MNSWTIPIFAMTSNRQLEFTLSYTFAKSNVSITNGWLVFHLLKEHCLRLLWVAKMQIGPYLLPPWRLVITSFEKFSQKTCRMHLARWLGTNHWDFLYLQLWITWWSNFCPPHWENHHPWLLFQLFGSNLCQLDLRRSCKTPPPSHQVLGPCFFPWSLLLFKVLPKKEVWLTFYSSFWKNF
jgi:hypothetical protein